MYVRHQRPQKTNKQKRRMQCVLPTPLLLLLPAKKKVFFFRFVKQQETRLHLSGKSCISSKLSRKHIFFCCLFPFLSLFFHF